MAHPSRFRLHRNGPEASAIYNEKFTKGCHGCRHSKKMKTLNEPYFCVKSIKGFPNKTRFNCELWAKRIK